jgi:hypothetical protein
MSLLVTEHAATICGVILGRERVVAAAARRVRDDLVEGLLLGRGRDAADAARWAAHLSSLPALEHDNSLDIDGENLWRGSKNAYTPEDMVELWIDEKAAFKNGVFPDVSTSGQWEDVGHYTQVVWRKTAEVGCALDEAGEDEVLVCRYMEGGNFEGEKTY